MSNEVTPAAGAPALAAETAVEAAKRNGHHLRGTLAATLASDATHFGSDDTTLLKFHGSYQQTDRDVKKPRGGEPALEKAYSFMARVVLPAGTMTADQYLRFEGIAERYASRALRITTRQGFQFHGVLKDDLRPTIAAVNENLSTTLAACGDVSRNVLGCPAPINDAAHRTVVEAAHALARELRPASRAYHELWLDGEKLTPDPTTATAATPAASEEPFYGDQYLPRKFKVAVAVADEHGFDNCVDVFSHDVGLVAIARGDAVLGFNVYVGGGLGMTHNKGDTTARLAEPLGFVRPEHAAETARAVAAVFRDHGNRADRRHSRLKYLLADWGIERFREEIARRVSFAVAPAAELPPATFHDHLGTHEQEDGRFYHGVFVQNGRIVDLPGHALKTALREVAERLRPGVRLTAQQNVLFTDLDAEGAEVAERILREHGVAPGPELSAVRRFSMACPALPTCSLAVAEAERFIATVLEQLEAETRALGVDDAPLTVRMTGCPNGCARPYTADLAFVGRSVGLYNVYVGGRREGDRMADLFRADVRHTDLLAAVQPLLARAAAERLPDEALGDFYQRALGRSEPRRVLTGREQPTFELVQLAMAN